MYNCTEYILHKPLLCPHLGIQCAGNWHLYNLYPNKSLANALLNFRHIYSTVNFAISYPETRKKTYNNNGNKRTWLKQNAFLGDLCRRMPCKYADAFGHLVNSFNFQFYSWTMDWWNSVWKQISLRNKMSWRFREQSDACIQLVSK